MVKLGVGSFLGKDLFKKVVYPYLCRPKKQVYYLFLSYGSVVQLVRMPPCHGGGRGFESRPVRRICNQTRASRGFLVFGSIKKSIMFISVLVF